MRVLYLYVGEDKHAVMESTEEGQCLKKCARMTAMEEGKVAFLRDCVRVTPSHDAMEEGKQVSEEDTTLLYDAFEESKQTQTPSCDAIKSGTRNWADIAPDLLANILVHLPLDELITEIPFVCKAWKLASEYPLCWEKLDFSDPTLAICGTPRLIERALRHCQGRLLEINASCLYDRHCLDLLACRSVCFHLTCISLCNIFPSLE